jgi:hypothetical protein
MAAQLPQKNFYKAGIVILKKGKDDIKDKYYLGHSGGDLYLKKFSKWFFPKNEKDKLNLLQVDIFKDITKIYEYDNLKKYLKDNYNLYISSDGWVKNSENIPIKYKKLFVEKMLLYNENAHITDEGKLKIFNPYSEQKKINPPKGDIDEKDKDIIDAAIREFYEEIGIKIPRKLITDKTTEKIKYDNTTYFIITKDMYDLYDLPELPIGDIITSELFNINWYTLSESSNRFKKIIGKKTYKPYSGFSKSSKRKKYLKYGGVKKKYITRKNKKYIVKKKKNNNKTKKKRNIKIKKKKYISRKKKK